MEKILLLLFLVSCATSRSVKGPDGTIHQLISCNELRICYQEASEICPQKTYKIVNSTGVVREGVKEYDLLIKCDS